MHRKVTTLKVTIDSTEPLADVIRVLGAMYDVTLRVAPSDTTKETPASPGRAVKAALPHARKARTPKPRASSTTETPRPAKTGGTRVSASELRSWARQHGYTVSDHGRVPAAIESAYRLAHKS